ncbi:MAG: hypothetical protein LBC29_04490, partial [Propionibacteriaceae bacterium]|nr:hypothetical protein [Propionibacteriaceae bacterium]
MPTQPVSGGVQLIEKSLWDERDNGAALTRALQGVAPAMEVDARLSADGVFLLSHSDTTASGKSISSSTAADLTGLSGLAEALPLRAALEVLAAHPDKHLVVEVKTLGESSVQENNAERLRALALASGVAERITISSLSPSILLLVHRVWPEVPLILNAAIVPVFSYPTGWFGRLVAKRLRAGRGYLKLGFRQKYVVLATGEGALTRPRVQGADGVDGDVSYALTELPEALLQVLRDQAARGVRFGGAVSVASVTAYCNGLRRIVFLRGYADRIHAQAIAALHQRGVNVQSTTWGAINTETRVADWQPVTQLRRLLAAGFGRNDMVYTHGI